MSHSNDARAQQQPLPRFPAPVPPTNAMAILSLVFAFLFWPLGIVFGHIALHQIHRSGEGGHGLATAGLVISYVFLGCIVLVLSIGFAIGMSRAITSGVIY